MLPILLQSSVNYCPASAPFFGFMGVSCALVFANLGAAFGTAKSAVGISSMGVITPDKAMKNIIPVIMAGILGIYGLIISILVAGAIPPDSAYTAFNGYAHLAAGLACGLSSLGAGFAIGISGDAGVRASGQQDKMFVPMVLILIFAEALGLYGLIIGIILSQKKSPTGPGVAGACTLPPNPVNGTSA